MTASPLFAADVSKKRCIESLIVEGQVLLLVLVQTDMPTHLLSRQHLVK